MAEPALPADLGVPPAGVELVFGERASAIGDYARILSTTGVDHGLVGPREVPRLWERHILNCGVVAPALPEGARVADVGSGAGLPGLVWAVARPDVEMHLVEPLLRRTRWLEDTVAALGLTNVTIHRARAEAMVGELEVDVVTARAVSRLDTLAGWCLPLLTPGGRMLALKGAAAQEELDEAAGLLRRLGAVDAAVEEYGADLLDPPSRVVRIDLGDRPAGGRRGGRGRRRSGGSRPRG